MEKQKLSGPHNVIMEERARLTISGVEDVESFDEGTIAALTSQGSLIIRGTGLRVEKLSIEGGELKVEGHITELCYEEAKDTRGLWARMFG